MTIFSKKITPFTTLVICLILFRAFLNFAVPLMDKTEARYAEIARIMEETNDYTTPQIDYGVPFWAKPPLSTWASALSYKVFGVNEFAARFPYLIFNILILFLIGRYAREKELDFYIPAFVLLTIPEFLLHAGVVSTDTALGFCVTLVMISFWETVKTKDNKLWSHLFFIGLGLGLLAKGPIIFILTMPPLFVWTVYFKQFKTIWLNFKWILGIALLLIIGLPWYYLAELKTPGFIDYFIIGEHFKRFFDSSWKGDLYGFPKSQPLGMIWLFLIAFTIPWIVVVFTKLWKNIGELLKNKWIAFLVAWLLWTPIFFSVSKSLIHPYIVPVLVPIALLVTFWWNDIKNLKRYIYVSLAFPVIAFVFYVGLQFTPQPNFYINSDKYLIENQQDKNLPLFYYPTKSYSSQFYSKGKVQELTDTIALNTKIAAKIPFLVIIPNKKLKDLSQEMLHNLEKIDANYKNGIYILK